MALTNTDKKEIERIARKEIKDFLKNTQFEKKVVDVVMDEMNKRNGRMAKAQKDKIVDISSKVLIELYKTFWLRRNFWDQAIKNVR